MLNAITNGVATVVQLIGTVLTSIVDSTGELSAVLPIIGLAIGMGVVGFGIKTIKSLVWGF